MFKYLLVYFSPLVIFLSLNGRGMSTYTAVIALFIAVPLIELIFRGTEKNMEKTEEKLASKNRIYDFIIYSMLPLQFYFIFLFLNTISSTNLEMFEKIGMTLAMGTSCGVLGINVAHELGHRRTRYEQWMAKTLLMTSLYMHFFIEHNKGHHKHVSTDLDPASSKLGESLYSFYIRSIRDSWISAWNIESERLRRKGQRIWSLQNEMLQYSMIQIVFCFIIFFVFGLEAFYYFLAAAFIGVLLLEAVNYIQHYGLRRKKKGEDSYERTLPIHSWNSNASLGRILLFELTRHSDHHYMTTRKYQILRNFDESPQLPTGYPGTMIMSFLPPLWFRVMDRRIQKFKESES